MSQPSKPAPKNQPLPVEPVYEPLEESQPAERFTPNAADSQLLDMAQDASPLGINDIAIPRLVVTQPTSSFEGASEHAGQWFNSVTGEFSMALNVVIVRVSLQRAVFPNPFDPNIPVLCASPNAIKPYEEYHGREVEGITIDAAEGCTACPLSQWGENDPISGKGEPPRCSMMYLYTGLEADTGMPFSMRLKGTALTAAKKLNFLWQQYQHTIVLQLSTAPGKSNTGRKFFVPTIAMTGQVTPEHIGAMAARMLGSLRRAPVQERPAVSPDESDIPF